MKSKMVAVSIMLLLANTGWAQIKNFPFPLAKVSFDDFKGLVTEVETHRAKRLIDLDTFLKMSQEPGVIVLDTRSTFRFDRLHVKGAKHLSFTDFTQNNLLKVIPSFETKILIYCNNNFDGNQTDFASKVALPRTMQATAAATQIAMQEKPIMMALNIPTYINLYGYGYCNVYELYELVKVSDPRIAFEGSIVTNAANPLSQTVAVENLLPIRVFFLSSGGDTKTTARLTVSETEVHLRVTLNGRVDKEASMPVDMDKLRLTINGLPTDYFRGNVAYSNPRMRLHYSARMITSLGAISAYGIFPPVPSYERTPQDIEKFAEHMKKQPQSILRLEPLFELCGIWCIELENKTKQPIGSTAKRSEETGNTHGTSSTP